MTLGEALHRYLHAGVNGQLIIKFSGEDHLCKIAIDDGHAVYIRIGKKGPEETLSSLTGQSVEWIDFIEGLPTRKRLPHSLNKTLLEIVTDARPDVTTPAGTTPAKTDKGLDLSRGATAEIVEAIIEDFVDLIGPLGTVLAEKAAQDLDYCHGATMEPATLERFVSILGGEIPETVRQAFLDKYST